MRGRIGRPLTSGRWCALVCAAVVAAGAPIVGGAMGVQAGRQAEPSGARPKFEVASVKRNQSGRGPYQNGFEVLPGGGIRTVNAPLSSIVAAAYGITHRQLDDNRSDLGGMFVDIDARAGAAALPADAPADARRQQARLMVQDLLAERFKLTLHTETREVPVYALVVAGNGPRLKASPADRVCPPACADMRAGPASGLSGRSVQVSAIASTLNYFLDREVIDQTGISGLFDVDLPPWSSAAHLPVNPSGDGDEPAPSPSGPSIFTVLQEQLGLQLEATRADREIYVIDHVEEPTPD
jgi:uncharacterized protein (TIGR03435 family)